MARSSTIRVMISSRCKSTISFQGKPQELTVLRRAVKQQVEGFRFPGQGKRVFTCWINEDASGAPGTETWWSHCIRQAKDADIVLTLFTGSAGGGMPGSDIGVCHAELEAAMEVAGDRVRLIKLPPAPDSPDPLDKKRDTSFRGYVNQLAQFSASVKTGEEVVEQAWCELQESLVKLTQLGGHIFHLGQASTGAALEWHRMSYDDRKAAMEGAIVESLRSRPYSLETTNGVVVRVDQASKSLVFVRPHATPASLAESRAREMVGQPFLSDHEFIDQLAKPKAGPIHMIACPKGVTENQAMRMLGFPDATVVSDSFGIHVADSIQQIQIVLLKECVSPTAIKRQVAAWFDFLERTNESQYVLSRAKKRFKIVKVIAAERI